jgi:hypothetical protein
MIVSGEGIAGDGSLEWRVRTNYRPDTALSLTWVRSSSGQYVCTDRGADADRYSTRITVVGSDAYVDSVLASIRDNREAGSNELTLSGFAADEKIFGADVSYASTITATATKWGLRRQVGLHLFKTEIEMQARSVTFSSTAQMPALTHLVTGYTNEREPTIVKLDSYSGAFTYVDSAADAGLWTGVFQLSLADLGRLRRYRATLRGGTFEVYEIAGVNSPMEPERTPLTPGAGWDHLCKIISLTDETYISPTRWSAKLTLAEAF